MGVVGGIVQRALPCHLHGGASELWRRIGKEEEEEPHYDGRAPHGFGGKRWAGARTRPCGESPPPL